MHIIRHSNKLRVDAHPITVSRLVPANSPLKDTVDLEFLSDLPQALVSIFVLHGAGTRDHSQTGKARKTGSNLVGDAVRKIFILRSAEVLKRQHRQHRALGRFLLFTEEEIVPCGKKS